jgi:hypothetical protein
MRARITRRGCRRGAVKGPVAQKRTRSATLPDPVALETEEQTLEREQNERDVLT